MNIVKKLLFPRLKNNYHSYVSHDEKIKIDFNQTGTSTLSVTVLSADKSADSKSVTITAS